MARVRSSRFFCIALSVASLLPAVAQAQRAPEKYPSRPVRMIVPFAPGGGTDIVARAVTQKIGEAVGQSIVIDNRGGGGGTIGAETTVRSVADGYTLCMVSASYATNAAMFKLPYDPIADITPIVLAGETALVISMHPGVAARSLNELIALAKAKPGTLNYASTGTGGNTHLATELFDMLAGTKMNHVPYKGTGAAMNDLLGGQIQLIFGSLPSVLPHVRSGRLRGVAVTTSKRNSALPDLPTVAEAVPGYHSTVWYGLWGPKGLPRPVVEFWNTQVRKALQMPEVRERLAGEGLEIFDGPPSLFEDIVKRDVAKWKKVIAAANIRPVQ